MFRRVLIGALICGAAASCTRGLFVAPTGPGTPAPEAATAWDQASRGCRDARSFTAALQASGRVAGARLWPIAIQAAVTKDQSIYLSASASGTSLFVLAGTGNRATLWLRREERVVTAAPAEIMDAIIGVSLTPDQLLAALTGCGTRSAGVSQATRHGNLLAIDTADARVYLESRASMWRTRAAETGAFIVEFGWGTGPLPADLWIWSAPNRQPVASLHLSISDGEIDGTIPAGVFQMPAAAATATPITLDELRKGIFWKGLAPDSERPR
jgi:hypothetical protein